MRNLEDFVDVSLIEPEVLYENLSVEKRDHVVSERGNKPRRLSLTSPQLYQVFSF